MISIVMFVFIRKDNVEEYLIIDDGKGMSQSEIENALDLGLCDRIGQSEASGR